MKLAFLLLFTFAAALQLVGCSEEPYRIEDSVCGKFLKNNPDIAKDYLYITCFDSTHVVYQKKYGIYEAYLAEVQENRIEKKQKIMYDVFSRVVKFSDLESTTDISNGVFSLARKNDSTFYIVTVPFGPPPVARLFSREGKEIRKLFSFYLETSCFEYPIIYHTRPYGTDSTLLLKFYYVREEDKQQYAGYLSLDLKKDTLTFGSEDPMTKFAVTHYKANGDSVITMERFTEEELEKPKRRKCIGHVIY